MAQAGRGRPRPKIENPGKLLKRLLSYVFRYYKWQMLIVFACIGLSIFANTQGTLFTRTLIDEYIDPLKEAEVPDYVPLAHAIARVSVFYLIGILAQFAQARIMVYVTQGTMKRMRGELFVHMEGLPVKYFDTHAHGDIMSVYTNDIDTMRQMVSQSIPQLVNSVITIITILTMMFVLSVRLTFVSLGMVLLMIVASAFISKRSASGFVAQQKGLGVLNGYIEETMTGQKVVKVFCHEKQAVEQFDVLNEELYRSAFRAQAFGNMIGPVSMQMGNLSYVVCAIVGGTLAVNPASGFTVGSLASFLTFNRNFNMPINQVTMQFNMIFMALAGAQRIFALLDEKPEEDEGYVTLVYAKEENGALTESETRTGKWAWKHYHKADNTTTYVPLEGDVTFLGVDFGYTDEKMVLHDIVLHAKPGQKIALVGSTGAGKTTITNLINRFYTIQDGKIRYDNINVNKIRQEDLRRSLGMVLQDTHLFTGTVMENIRYGKLDATDEEVIAAAKLANAHTFIKRLPEGYETKLTGDGANLSQGQRQLLAIARAAIADPPVLILDEATSSIDTRTERLVQDGMDHLMKGRTTFVIAHRLSTVRNADQILVMEQGRIIERGTHDELIALGQKYYQLYTGSSATA
ncbi:MAG: ABC transporter ATP-binding protein [Lachnospiraceae bacterium]|nr:ABC transporter ATP-binding protein [Lachnospiraceae bacterium]